MTRACLLRRGVASRAFLWLCISRMLCSRVRACYRGFAHAPVSSIDSIRRLGRQAIYMLHQALSQLRAPAALAFCKALASSKIEVKSEASATVSAAALLWSSLTTHIFRPAAIQLQKELPGQLKHTRRAASRTRCAASPSSRRRRRLSHPRPASPGPSAEQSWRRRTTTAGPSRCRGSSTRTSSRAPVQ